MEFGTLQVKEPAQRYRHGELQGGVQNGTKSKEVRAQEPQEAVPRERSSENEARRCSTKLLGFPWIAVGNNRLCGFCSVIRDGRKAPDPSLHSADTVCAGHN